MFHRKIKDAIWEIKKALGYDEMWEDDGGDEGHWRCQTLKQRKPYESVDYRIANLKRQIGEIKEQLEKSPKIYLSNVVHDADWHDTQESYKYHCLNNVVLALIDYLKITPHSKDSAVYFKKEK